MKNGTIRKMLAVVGLAAALTGCGEANSASTLLSEGTVQEEEPDSASEENEKDPEPETGDETSASEAGEADETQAGEDETGSADAGEEASFEDGVYITCDNIDVKDPDAEKYAAFEQAEIKDGILTITGSFEQQDDNWDQTAYYTYETRELPVAEDVVVEFGGGEGEPEKSTVDTFNSFYADPNASDRESHRGLGVMITIEDGEVKVIDICS